MRRSDTDSPVMGLLPVARTRRDRWLNIAKQTAVIVFCLLLYHPRIETLPAMIRVPLSIVSSATACIGLYYDIRRWRAWRRWLIAGFFCFMMSIL